MRHTELEQLRACRKILARFHLAKDWIDSDGATFDDDELVANIVLGGSTGAPGTINDALTWSELKALAKMHDWLVRRVTREDHDAGRLRFG